MRNERRVGTGTKDTPQGEYKHVSSNANRQWGGRFAEGPSAIMEAINASIGFDRKMWKTQEEKFCRLYS